LLYWLYLLLNSVDYRGTFNILLLAKNVFRYFR